MVVVELGGCELFVSKSFIKVWGWGLSIQSFTLHHCGVGWFLRKEVPDNCFTFADSSFPKLDQMGSTKKPFLRLLNKRDKGQLNLGDSLEERRTES